MEGAVKSNKGIMWKVISPTFPPIFEKFEGYGKKHKTSFNQGFG